MKKALLIFIIITCLSFLSFASQAPSGMIHDVVKQVKRNIDSERDYGYYMNLVIRKMNGEEEIKRKEFRIYRTTWIEGRSFAELLSINNQPPSSTERLKENKRKAEFIKTVKGETRSNGLVQELQAINWDGMCQGYDFVLKGQQQGLTVVTFHPNGRTKDRTRFEKLFHKLEGTIWLDPENNVVQATAHLTGPVKFGWGLFAKVDELTVRYTQQKHLSAWAPAHLNVRFRARIALLKMERQELTADWYNPFPKRPAFQTVENLPHSPVSSTTQR